MKFIAVSNISEDGLRKIFDLSLEGLPCPSIQLKPFNYTNNIEHDDTLFSFGSISFIFKKEHIFGDHSKIPKNNATYEIFTGDGYTLRFPDLKYSIFKPNLTNLKNDIVKLLNELEDFPMDDFFNKIQSIKSRDYFIDRAIDSITMKLLFLKDHDYLHHFNPIFSKKEHSSIFKNDLRFQNLLKDISRESISNNPELYIDFIEDKIKNSNKHDKMIFDLLKDNDVVNPLLLLTFFKDDISLIKNQNFKTYERIQTIELINKLVKEVEETQNIKYQSYIASTAKHIYHDPKIEENNKPANIDNIVSYMKRKRGLGEEQGNFTGINRFLAMQKHKIHSVSELKDYLYCITDRETKTLNDEKIRKMFDEISLLTNISYFDLIDKFVDLGTQHNDKHIIKVFDNLNFNDNPELLNKIKEFLEEARNSKHLYYEAKINQAFYFPSYPYGYNGNKLSHVIVPDNIAPDLLSNLEKLKFNIIKYDHTDPISRLKAFKQCEHLFIDSEPPKPKSKIKI